MLDYVLPKDTQMFDIEDLSAADFILNERMDFSLDGRASPEPVSQVSPGASPDKENGGNNLGSQSLHQREIMNPPNDDDPGLNHILTNTVSLSETAVITEDNPQHKQVTDTDSVIREGLRVAQDDIECSTEVGESGCNRMEPSGGNNLKQKNGEKPDDTYLALIAKAMLDSRKTKLTLRDIHTKVIFF